MNGFSTWERIWARWAGLFSAAAFVAHVIVAHHP